MQKAKLKPLRVHSFCFFLFFSFYIIPSRRLYRLPLARILIISLFVFFSLFLNSTCELRLFLSLRNFEIAPLKVVVSMAKCSMNNSLKSNNRTNDRFHWGLINQSVKQTNKQMLKTRNFLSPNVRPVLNNK